MSCRGADVHLSAGSPGNRPTTTLQLGLFRSAAASDTRLSERIRAIDVDQLTPLEALSLLAELKKDLGNSES